LLSFQLFQKVKIILIKQQTRGLIDRKEPSIGRFSNVFVMLSKIMLNRAFSSPIFCKKQFVTM